jgi:signal transduction histidine kinase
LKKTIEQLAGEKMKSDIGSKFNLSFPHTIILMIAFFMSAITVGISGCEHRHSVSEPSDALLYEITEGWEYRWGDSPFDTAGVPIWTYEDTHGPEWKSVGYAQGVVNPPDRQGRKNLWLRVPLPDKTWPDPQLYLRGVRFACQVYLEDTLIYRYKSVNTPGQGKFTEDPFHLLPLGDDFQNKFLFFRIYSGDLSYIGLEVVTLGSRADILHLHIRQASAGLIFGFLFVSIGLITLIISIKRKEKTYFVFGFFCICIGLWTFLGTGFEQHFLDAPRFWFYLTTPLPYLTAVGLCAHFEGIFGAGYKSMLRRMWQFFLVFGAVSLFFLYTTLLPMRALLLFQMIWFVLFGAAILVLFGTSLNAAFRGNKEARIITIGFAALCVFGVYDILGGALKVVPWRQNLYPWGMFFFIVSLGFVLERRFHNYALELEKSNVKLREYSQTLELKVKERTIDLENKNMELASAMKELEETQNQLIMKEKMASLGNLVAGVAHEVNNPIGAVHSAADVTGRCIGKIRGILKSSQTLQEVNDSAQLHKSLQILEDNNKITALASDRIEKIVRSLRGFARLDEAEYQKADIHEGLNSTLTLLEHEMKDRIAVVKEYGQVPEINCYPSQLNQVFMNVLKNAVQAIEEKGRIAIKTYLDNGKVMVEISDDGSGIPPEDIDKIFNPGFTTRGVGVGTGLGLSISYNIIEKHHGDIRVTSEVGKGTSFTIVLPVEGV